VKKTLAAILAAVIIFSGNALRAQYTARDNTRIQQDYAYYNEAFFNNTLPKNTVVVWSNIPKEERNSSSGKISVFIMGNTHEDADGTFTISVDTKSNITQVTTDITILHEMCHVKTLDFAQEHDQDVHGPAFKACVVELEMQGAFTDLL
jgi:hypothetical protein